MGQGRPGHHHESQCGFRRYGALSQNPIFVPPGLSAYRKSTPKYIPKRTENIDSHKNLYTHVHSSITQSSQKADTTHMSTN